MRILTGDLLIFSILVLIYTRLQKKWPNFFYPLSTILLILPPSDEEFSALLSKDKENTKKGKSKLLSKGLPLKFFKGTYDKLKNLPRSSDVEFIMMFSIITSLHILITELLKNFLPEFYKETVILLFLAIFFATYQIKILLEVAFIGGFKFYSLRINLSLTFAFISIIALLFYSPKCSTLLDFEFQEIFEQTQQHLFFIFANQINFYAFTLNQFIALFLLLSAIFALALFPSILIFCENFVAAYIELIMEKAKANNNNSQEGKGTKKEYAAYNCILILNLLILCLYITNIKNLFPEEVGNYLKLGLIIVHLILCQRCWKWEIGSLANKNYTYLKSLSDNFSTNQFQMTKQKCTQNVQILGLKALQICCRTTIPLIIVLMLISNLRLFQLHDDEPRIQDTCKISNNINDVFFNLSKCSIDHAEFNPASASFKDLSQEILNRGYKYGFYNRSLFIFLTDYFLFIYYFLNYAIAIPYIYFLKKSYEF